MPGVLFLCTHNADRSLMAAGWARLLAGGRVQAWSGGSDPEREADPAAVAAMAEVGADIAQESPRTWTGEMAGAADVVVTMGCGDACPVYPGVRYVDWEVADPAGQDIGRVRAIRDEIGARVRALLAELGVDAPAA